MTTTLGFHLLRIGHCSHPECVTQRGGRLGTVPFPALAGLLLHPGLGPMLFDTGYSDAFFAATQPFPERLYRLVTPVSLTSGESLPVQLAQYGHTLKDIRHVFLSHLHADHIAGIGELPNARFFAMRDEVDAMRRASRIGGLRRGYLRTLLPDSFDARLTCADDCQPIKLPPAMHPFTHGFDMLGDASVIGVPLPGHTPGQLGILFKIAGNQTVFLVADACWSLEAVRHDKPPSWIASRLFSDKTAYLATFAGLRHLLGRHEGLTIVPSHCELTWRRIGRALR